MSRFQLGGLSPGSNRCPPPCSASALHHVLPAQCHVPPARYAMHFQCVAKLRQLATPTLLTFLSPTIIIITSVHSFFRCLLITTVLNRCVWLTASLWIAGVDATRRARPLCFGLTQMWNKGGSTRCCYIHTYHRTMIGRGAGVLLAANLIFYSQCHQVHLSSLTYIFWPGNNRCCSDKYWGHVPL